MQKHRGRMIGAAEETSVARRLSDEAIVVDDVETIRPWNPNSRVDRVTAAIMSRGGRIRSPRSAAALMALALVAITAVAVLPLPPARAVIAQSRAHSPAPTDVRASFDTEYMPTFVMVDGSPVWFVAPGDTSDPQYEGGSPAPVPTQVPVTAGKWPVSWDGQLWPMTGADGTIYLIDIAPDDLTGHQKVTALDGSGRERDDWLVLPDRSHQLPTATAADGTMFVVSVNTIYSFDAAGSPRKGWPVEGSEPPTILPGPGGTLYVQWGNERFEVLDANGTAKANGTLPTDEYCGAAGISPDGTIYLNCGYGVEGGGLSIAVYASDGRRLSTTSPLRWGNPSMSPNGTLLAWRPEITETVDGQIAKDTVVAVIGKDGKPKPGWPKTFAGAASDPVIDATDTIYITLAGSSSTPAQVIALDTAGKVKPGWPYKFAKGTSPRVDGPGSPGAIDYPVKPIPGHAGTVYVVADDATGESVIALGRDGVPLPGWPATLPTQVRRFSTGGECIDWCGPQYVEPIFVHGGAAQPRLYLHVGSSILALGENGQQIPGWPKHWQFAPDEDAFAGWWWWSAMPDGGLALIEMYPHDGGTKYVLKRFAPDGTLAG